MLDSLLGRASLKERIEELEEERDRLERRLEAEQERRIEAVSERQRAEEDVNRLEDRIAELEDRVERASGGERTLEFRRTEDLRGDRLTEVLDRLRSVETGPEGALTAYVADQPPSGVEAAFGDRAALVRRAAPCLALADDAGLVSVALDPPLPPEPFAEWGEGFRLPAEWFRPSGTFTLALLRSDLFALGVYEGGERVDAAAVETDVMGSHSKGGFSQARFERRRDEQVREHLDRAREAFEEHARGTRVLVGERTVLDDVDWEVDATATVDATGDPEEALADAVREFFTVRLHAV